MARVIDYIEKSIGGIGFILLGIGSYAHIDFYVGVGLGIIATSAIYRIWGNK